MNIPMGRTNTQEATVGDDDTTSSPATNENLQSRGISDIDNDCIVEGPASMVSHTRADGSEYPHVNCLDSGSDTGGVSHATSGTTMTCCETDHHDGDDKQALEGKALIGGAFKVDKKKKNPSTTPSKLHFLNPQFPSSSSRQSHKMDHFSDEMDHHDEKRNKKGEKSATTPSKLHFLHPRGPVSSSRQSHEMDHFYDKMDHHDEDVNQALKGDKKKKDKMNTNSSATPSKLHFLHPRGLSSSSRQSHQMQHHLVQEEKQEIDNVEDSHDTGLNANHGQDALVGSVVRNSNASPGSEPGAFAAAPGATFLLRNENLRFSLVGSSAGAGAGTAADDAVPHLVNPGSGPNTRTTSARRLAEAVPVADESGHLDIGQAEAVDLEAAREVALSRQKERRGKLIAWSIFLGVIALSVGAMAVVFGTRRNRRQNSNQDDLVSTNLPTMSVAPSLFPSLSPTVSAAPTSYLDFLPEHTLHAIGVKQSPQNKAATWLSQHPDYSGMPSWRKKQLMALASFYYSMNGEKWAERRNWMDYGSHECSWYSALDTGSGYGQNFVFNNDPEDYPLLCVHVANGKPFRQPNPFSSNCNENGEFQYLLPRSMPLHGSLPPEISFLTALTVVGLQDNTISGIIPTTIGFLTALDLLDLSSNTIRGVLPSEIGLANLTQLILRNNSLSGSLPSELGRLTALIHLRLEHNAIFGELPSEIGSLSNVGWFDVHNNSLSSTLPTEVGLLRPRFLVLRDNLVTGWIPSEIGDLTSLRYLSLERNKFSGVLPTIFHHLRASRIMLSDNLLSGIPSSIGLFNLTFPGNLVTGFGEQDVLQIFDLKNNMITSVPSELFLLSTLYILDLSGNQLTSLPPAIGNMEIVHECGFNILLQNNKFTEVPRELSLLTNLTSLEFDNNLISKLPTTDWGLLTNLKTLNMCHNKWTTIPAELTLLSSLENLGVCNNQLEGPIITELGLFDQLETLDLSSNHLSSTIPRELGLLSALMILNISSNFLTGKIPTELGFLVRYHDDEYDYKIEQFVSGNWSWIQQLDLSHNQVQGSIITEFGLFDRLEILDLSFNKLTGTIPTELGHLVTPHYEYDFQIYEYVSAGTWSWIEILDLSHNQLGGPIITELGLLDRLERLDLSFNNLTGTIPNELAYLNSIRYISLAGNHHLTGRIPANLCPLYCNFINCATTTLLNDITLSACNTTGILQVHCELASGSSLDCQSCACQDP